MHHNNMEIFGNLVIVKNGDEISEMRIKRVFLSYGMHGRTEEEQKAVRDKLAQKAQTYDFSEPVWVEVIDNSDAKTDGGRLSYLGLAIQKMDTCDAIIFDDDWYKHKGCIIERHVAELYGLKILGVDDEEE